MKDCDKEWTEAFICRGDNGIKAGVWVGEPELFGRHEFDLSYGHRLEITAEQFERICAALDEAAGNE